MNLTSPLRVGIVGTGFAAKTRTELFSQDQRVQVKGIAGNWDRVQAIAQEFNTKAYEFWSELVIQPDLDVIVVSTVNREHGAIVRQALNTGKHVVVEYPLCLGLAEAKSLVELANHKDLMLHIEHIELLGKVHLLAAQALPTIGEPYYIRYATTTPQCPAPDKWTYMPELFGFPLVAATSRIHRLTAMFGKVSSVTCQLSYLGDDLPRRFSSCICNAQLKFTNGAIADVSYKKGESFWTSERSLEIQGTKGAIVFAADSGKLITVDGEVPLIAEAPKGLFKQDTQNVIDHLLDGKPLYTNADSAVYALAVACAAEKSAALGQTVIV
ncbi:putative dehydrogenase [Synechococcus sp. PCC 7502]|uniref:Gfo/Idh/MocA family protein n=1 Tax=Synechococcus sp. PCC 7502 TaxID=1173263 RepID=UPI00029FC279|nr:Gfo/Idh/MocA family oxidoreductase [Synechococcus sp. PCC 7502]AFY74629.1 putative dehydrogenase [Synechococcus sp. PCC 7502]